MIGVWRAVAQAPFVGADINQKDHVPGCTVVPAFSESRKGPSQARHWGGSGGLICGHGCVKISLDGIRLWRAVA